jgi:hypothetical protein
MISEHYTFEIKGSSGKLELQIKAPEISKYGFSVTVIFCGVVGIDGPVPISGCTQLMALKNSIIYIREIINGLIEDGYKFTRIQDGESVHENFDWFINTFASPAKSVGDPLA